MREAGFRAEMVYTGQTGWMQGAKYGFVFDSTLNDFISGEMEHAVVQCWEEAKPDIMFIEGQSSLRNPSGPAGAEWIVSADASAVVLQHNPARKKYKGLEDYPANIADLQDEIALIKIYGAPTVAITINTHKMSETDARIFAASKEKELGIPVILPLEDGVQRLVAIFKDMIEKSIAQV
ncbi:MAG: NAD-dependent epimerase/dehydratase family protein, partial [Cytophagales bacterium]|nr:NAD-dependent epimerase/dehydratase family protein [Cytophagales bacterium]